PRCAGAAEEVAAQVGAAGGHRLLHRARDLRPRGVHLHRGALPRRHGFPVVGSPQKGHACAHHGLGGWSRLGRSSGRDMMRRKTNNLAWALALSTMLPMLLAPAHASQSPDGQASNNLRINTFSGAYLATQIAEADNDLASSVAFYERALAFNPDDD